MLRLDDGWRYPVSRLKIEELNAQIALLDRFGPGGIAASLAWLLGGLVRVLRNATHAALRHMAQCVRDCQIA
jgi:hypothetical protein